MAELKDKIQNALDECRMLVLGVQVLIGFAFRVVFEPGFAALPYACKLATLVSLVLLCITLGLLVTPGADHRLGERGESSPALFTLTTACSSLALLPFVLAIALAMAVATRGLPASGRVSLLAAALTGLVLLALWYGVELWRAREKAFVTAREPAQPEPLAEKIRHVLTEARVVLPGAQAMLGFQLVVVFASAFGELGAALKWIHFASLCMTLLAVALLTMPAAWHRIVEHGEETPGFHRAAGIMVLAALPPLGLGVVGDLYVVAQYLTDSRRVALVSSVAVGILFAVLWFGVGLWRRRGRPDRWPELEGSDGRLAPR